MQSVLILGFCGLLMGSPGFQPESMDVQELVGRKADWPKLATSKQSISLEGRFAARTGKLLRLQNCKLVFRVNSGVLIPRLRNDRNVELIGYLKDNGKQTFDFIVLRIAEGPSDLEQLLARRKTLPDNDPSPWFAVAERAARRAAFYEDSVLLQESQKTIERGFTIQRAQVRPGDHETLLKLAERSRELGLANNVRTEMLHEALRWRWDEIRKDPKGDSGEFLKLLEKELDNCTKRLLLANPRLKENYKFKPIRTYREGNFGERLTMNRYFYREVLLPQIVSQAKDDGSNGRHIATLLRGNIPEETELADEYELRELNWRLGNVESASRTDMMDVVDQLERTNRRAEAEQAKRKWVVASARRLASRGPAGLVQSAMEYDSLLGDRDKAVELLKKAWDQSSEKQEIEERLERYGVFRRNNRWLTQVEVNALPDKQIEQAQREGKVLPGMTPEQVRRSLGKPDRVTRFASKGRTHFVWLFGSSQGSRTGVVFERKLQQPDKTARVVSVSALPGR